MTFESFIDLTAQIALKTFVYGTVPRQSVARLLYFRGNLAKFRAKPYPPIPQSKQSPFSNLRYHRVIPMTMDRSLKVQAGAIKSRNVLTRAERIARLKSLDKFDEEKSIVGMPKVRVLKVSLKRKKKVKKAEDEPKDKKKK
ncbi:small basic protein [Rubripirellula reticaptiva]|nr:small basic protein [Rubripirellula reticaptiva]